MPNFTWWLNRKDRDGRNLFEGGFLGLDNIGVFDRSSPLPTGGYLEQADGTAWMAFYAQNMLDIALELALVDPTYEPMAVKFYEHVISIAAATNRMGAKDSMWDEEDGFFYDVLRVPGTVHDAAQGAGRSSACCRCARSRSTARRWSRSCRCSSSACSGSTRTAPSCSPTSTSRAGRARAAGSCCRC